MIGKEIISSEPIPAAKVRKILEDFSENHELNYEQNITLNHISTLNKLPAEDTEKLVEELETKLKRKYAVRVADLLPKDLADMRLIFAKERIPIKKEDMEEILEIVEKYNIE